MNRQIYACTCGGSEPEYNNGQKDFWGPGWKGGGGGGERGQQVFGSLQGGTENF